MCTSDYMLKGIQSNPRFDIKKISPRVCLSEIVFCEVLN